MPVREEGRSRGSVAIGVGRVVALGHEVVRGLPAVARRGSGHAANEGGRSTGKHERARIWVSHIFRSWESNLATALRTDSYLKLLVANDNISCSQI